MEMPHAVEAAATAAAETTQSLRHKTSLWTHFFVLVRITHFVKRKFYLA